jgi:hypothetical protein
LFDSLGSKFAPSQGVVVLQPGHEIGVADNSLPDHSGRSEQEAQAFCSVE